MPNENQALVYFFAKSNFGDNQPDFIKIGRTITDLSKRQTTLQTGNEAKIWEIGVIPFDSVDEASRKKNKFNLNLEHSVLKENGLLLHPEY